MKEELTTLMQAEFMENEMSELQLRCLAVYSQMRRGVKKEKALASNGLTAEEYDKNIEGALHA